MPDYFFLWRMARRRLRRLCFAIFLRRFFFTEPMRYHSDDLIRSTAQPYSTQSQ